MGELHLFAIRKKNQNYPLQFIVSVIPKHHKVLGHATTTLTEPKKLILMGVMVHTINELHLDLCHKETRVVMLSNFQSVNG